MGRVYRQMHILRDPDTKQPVLGPDGKPRKVLRSRYWWIRYRDADGKAHDESSESERKADAVALLRKREVAIDNGEPAGRRGRVTFEDAATNMINDYILNDRRSLGHLRGRITNHLRPVFGGRRLASITTDDLRQYSVDRRAAGASNAQINRELAIVKRMFSLAIENGDITHRPHVAMLEERNTRSGYFEPAQFDAVRAHLPEYLRPVATFAFYTGWRVKSEVLPLQTRQVDLRAGTVVLDPHTTKNDQARTLYFNPIAELRELLTAQLESAARLAREHGRIVSHVFHETNASATARRRAGQRITEKRLYAAWQAATVAAGYPGLILHDFRRTAARNLVRAGVGEDVAMKITGHKTRSMFSRYNVTDGRDLEDAAAKLEAHLSSKPATVSAAVARVRRFAK
jgi:integrase